MEHNTSGQGANATVPAEIDRWNWGAFLLNWIWGLGNNTFIALLMFVPFVNFVMLFVLGVKGSSWAWRNKRWDSIEHFKRVQRKWALWGVALVVVWALAMAAAFVGMTSMFKRSEPFQLAIAQLDSNPRAIELLGQPIETGTPMGSLEVSGPDGRASLSFSVHGPRGEGTVHVQATRDLGRWRIDRMALDDDRTGQRIDIVPAAGSDTAPHADTI